MFFLNFSSIWSFSFFFIITYLVLLASLLVYLLPIMLNTTVVTNLNTRKHHFYILSGNEMSYFTSCLLICLLLLNLVWSSSDITTWFGHIIFTSFHSKIYYLLIFMFSMLLWLSFTTNYFSSNELYDFIITKLNFLYWILFLFFSNSFFTVIFVIEVLSTLIFLLITTSTFSTSFFYKNITLHKKTFLHNVTPHTFIQSILFFFWVSLISSLNLFLFLIIFYNTVVSLDWFIVEHLFVYFSNVTSYKEISLLGLSWFVILFSIFLKCGVAPLFIWKPVFFKGVTLPTLAFYIIFFYFFLFLFFINFFTIYFNELFYYYTVITLVFVLLGLIMLLSILCESFFIKTFLAISSILNSLIVILSVIPVHLTDFYFFL